MALDVGVVAALMQKQLELIPERVQRNKAASEQFEKKQFLLKQCLH